MRLRSFLGGHDEDQCGRCSRCRIYNRRRSRSHEQGLQDESSPLVCSGVLREEWEGAKPWWTDASARTSKCTSRLGSGFLSTLPFAIKRPATRGDRAPRWRVFNSLVRRPSPPYGRRIRLRRWVRLIPGIPPRGLSHNDEKNMRLPRQEQCRRLPYRRCFHGRERR